MAARGESTPLVESGHPKRYMSHATGMLAVASLDFLLSKSARLAPKSIKPTPMSSDTEEFNIDHWTTPKTPFAASSVPWRVVGRKIGRPGLVT